MFESLRGSTRIGGSASAAPVARARGGSNSDANASNSQPTEDVLSRVRKLIPGEVLAAYVALGFIATDPVSGLESMNVDIVGALIFLVLTIFLRFMGTQDPTAENPFKTVQWSVVIVSGLAFVSLVYATGGQVFWHEAIEQQAKIGQIVAAAIGIAAPVILRGSKRVGVDSS